MSAHLAVLRTAALPRAEIFQPDSNVAGLGGGVGQGPMLGNAEAPNEG